MKAIIGKPLNRVDGEIKVTGRHLYPSDMWEDGTLLLGLKRSVHPHAIIKRVDTQEASKVDGVVRIFTYKDISGTNRYGVVHKDQQVLAEEKVRYIGDAICLVAATNREALKEAIDKIKVEYEVLPAVFDPVEAMKENAPKIHKSGNILQHTTVSYGDVEKGFKESDIIIEGSYSVPFIDHTPMETEAGFAKMQDGKITVWAGTQTPFRDRKEISKALGIPEEKIRVIAPFFGGGFGRKDGITVQIYLALAAYILKRPVKIYYSREESIQTSYHRHAAVMYYKTGAKRDGMLTAVQARLIFDTGAYASFGGEVMSLGVEHFAGPYRVPNSRVDGYAVYTNNIIGGAMRGFGVPQVTFAFESQMDKIAKALNMDRWEIRYKNALEHGDKTAIGHTLIYSTGVKRTLKKVRESNLWKGKDKLIAESTPFKRRGWGIACSYQGGGLGVGIPDFAEAKVELLPSGRYRVYGGISDMGQGNTTGYVQIASAALNAPVEMIEYTTPDTDRTLDSGPSAASRTTYIYGKALLGAIELLKDEILQVAAEKLSCPKNSCKLIDDRVESDKGTIHLSEIYKLLPEKKRVSTFYVDMPISKDRRDIGSGLPHIVYAYATHLAVVEVDILTGKVRVIGYCSVSDVGKVINPPVFEGQVEGAVAQGIGAALTEGIKLKDGLALNNNFTTYIVPTAVDVPQIEVIAVESAEPTGPFGLKGTGEINVDAPPAAVVSAIENAVGVRVSSLPVSPEEIIKSIEVEDAIP
ncbi:MAG: xanthine dehydrogenase family protein [Synergistetes bacterium]|nr:xanthine dehydrogenase family protein [Synergistota bacterium]